MPVDAEDDDDDDDEEPEPEEVRPFFSPLLSMTHLCAGHGLGRPLSPAVATQTETEDQAQVAPDSQPQRILQPSRVHAERRTVSPAIPSRCLEGCDARVLLTTCLTSVCVCRCGCGIGRRGRGRGRVDASDDVPSSRPRQRRRFVPRRPLSVPPSIPPPRTYPAHSRILAQEKTAYRIRTRPPTRGDGS